MLLSLLFTLGSMLSCSTNQIVNQADFIADDTQNCISISTDFTNESMKQNEMHDIWSVVNRISPSNGVDVRKGLKVNLVRMIGGTVKKVDGKLIPDLDFDPCRYDSISDSYIYNWDPLIARLNKIVYSSHEIFQIVLDQPCWAFQHGYTFIPNDSCDCVHFRENERVTIYGNSLPPANKIAYADFIKAMMIKLIDTYGKSMVSSWRFRVGSEIETPEHWKGTNQDFIDYYAVTEKAVRSVLPDAKIGLHTRPANFVYKDGTVLNYKNEPITSFAKKFIDYCYENHIRYDFWGISDYILIKSPKARDIDQKFNVLFAPLINNPKWNNSATLDLMEYSTVITMKADDNKGYLSCESTHSDIIDLCLSQLFYNYSDKGLQYLYRWGQRYSHKNSIGIELLNSMNGMVRYSTDIKGEPSVEGNVLNAFFAASSDTTRFDVLVYNYNASSLGYQHPEPISVSFVTNLPVGTRLFYRFKEYGRHQNKFQCFLERKGRGLLRTGWDEKGTPSRSLTESGLKAYEQFINPNPCVYTEWMELETSENGNHYGSVVTVKACIPSFALQKFEFRLGQL